MPLVFISVRNGLISGVLGFCFIIALFYMGKHPFLFPIYFDFRSVLLTVFMVLALKEYREDYQQGILYFWQGLISTFLLTLTFAISASLLIAIFSSIEPEFVSEFIRLAREQLNAVAPEVIERWGKGVHEANLAALPGTTGATLASDYFVKSFIISFFLSIIISVILRRQPKN